MPWNDNANPGPWGSPPPPEDLDKRRAERDRQSRRPGGPGGPRRPPGGGGPDPNEMLNQLLERLRRMMGGRGGGDLQPGAYAAIAGVAVFLWAASGVYIVQPNEQGVVTTFGAYSGVNGPGLRYHLPYPFQDVTRVEVTNLRRTDIGGAEGADVPEESLMLTGDENIVDLDFSVQWRVTDPAKYLFNIRDPDETVKAVGESAMREVIGKTALQPILTTARGQVQEQTLALMQRVLDSYNSGVDIDEVQIRNASPPPEVIDAFREVATAGQNAEANVNVARGEAAKIVQAARGYRAQVVREAEGEAARFNQVYEQYRLAPGVTRERLYIETMERVLARSNKVIVDSKGASAPIILPPDVFRPRAATTETAPTGAAQ